MADGTSALTLCPVEACSFLILETSSKPTFSHIPEYTGEDHVLKPESGSQKRREAGKGTGRVVLEKEVLDNCGPVLSENFMGGTRALNAPSLSPSTNKTVGMLGMPCFSSRNPEVRKHRQMCERFSMGSGAGESMRCFFAILSASGYYGTPAPG